MKHHSIKMPLKQCVVIGSTGLCIGILDHLLANNWNILNVISDDTSVIKHCKEKGLKLLDHLNQIEGSRFVLFSVSNYSIIPDAFLQNKEVALAINYHDSLLPKYAGVNSTTWAILNGEQSHGVTWHLITSGIDEGGILKQSIVPIMPNETAFSLNMKCFEEALKTFRELVDDLEAGTLTPISQDLTGKTYFGKEYIPENYAIISFDESCDEIDRLHRALDFGQLENYQNPVATLKMWDGKRLYIAEKIEVVKSGGSVPGKVDEVSENRVHIGLRDGILVVKQLRTISGEPVALKDTQFRSNQRVSPCLINEQERHVLASVRKNESKVQKTLSSSASTSASIFLKPVVHNDNGSYELHIPRQSTGLSTLFHLIALVLHKFCNQELLVPIKKEWKNPQSVKSGRFLSELLNEVGFLTLSPESQEISYNAFAEMIDNQVSKTFLIPKDFRYRYGLSADGQDIAVFISNDSVTDATSHRLSILVNDSSILLKGRQQDRILIDSLHSSIAYLLERRNAYESVGIKDISVISPSDTHKILHEWNRTEKEFPSTCSIPQLFEEQVLKTPNDIALVCNGSSLTYKTLNEQANRLARQIRLEYRRIAGSELPAGEPIPLCVERSLDMVIGMLAIMKAGAAYSPIEPGFPKDRIDFILKDTACKLVLTQTPLLPRLADQSAIHCIAIDADTYDQQSSLNLTHTYSSSDLAYIIYTSGTTGNPKGVMVDHSSAINTLWAMNDVYDFSSAHNKSSFFTSFIFDVSVTEIFCSLLRGGELHVFDNEHRHSPELLSKYIIDNKINYLYLPPAILGLLPKIDYPALRALIFAGEPCDQSVGAYWASKYPLYNYYGPTECAVYATGKRVNIRNVNEIGKPISNKKAYVLDKYMKPVPIGAIGELYIGGFGQANGYLNLPRLTDERFIPNPFQQVSEKTQSKDDRLYKTGDLVRWLPDGDIEYLGRNDFQIKIRGHRIELGEIESVLSSHPEIKQSVVLAKEAVDENRQSNGQKFLIGFYIAERPLDTAHVTKYLQDRVPDYMVPSHLIQLEAFPTTFSGKLDRTQLLDMKIDQPKRKLVQPASSIEKSVLAIWCEILQTTQIGIDDTFFQVGGNSLLAMALRTKLNQLFGLNLTAIALFQYPTVRSLCRHIETQQGINHPASPRGVMVRSNETAASTNDIAIIGMACRVPGANTLKQFWHNLSTGVESIRDVPMQSLNASGLDPAVINDSHFVKRAANIDDYHGFDADYFGFTPREAQSTDPQHRHFMEVVLEALEDSGTDPSTAKESIGLFAGQGETAYYIKRVLLDQGLLKDLGDFQLMINNDKDFLTTKISYKLNLSGPSLDIQSACSTSLSAVHIAISQLLSGECDIAVAGGVSITDRYGYLYKKGMIESSDGKCRSFDKDANGTVLSSGIGVVVLKPLAKALEQGDHIYAVVKATAINNDGGAASKVGYTAPSVQGQAQVIRRALAKSKIDPSTISYIEAHGTGTKIGDPIELAALHEVFSEQAGVASIAIGSVKSNIGHTDSAAGVIGLIKTALALKFRKIPPSLHFKEWNPEIARFNTIFHVNQELTDWKTINNAPRRAGVSSFGIGGTNAHMVLEEAPQSTGSIPSNQAQLMLFSAETQTALRKYLVSFTDYLDGSTLPELSKIAYTLQTGRKHRKYRCHFVTDSHGKLKEQLQQLSTATSPFPQATKQPDSVFMFSGQGSQYVKMAKGVYQNYPLFAQTVDACCKILIKKGGTDLLPLLLDENGDPSAAETLKQTQNAQPALFIIAYAMSKLLMSFDVLPAALIGHSIGEYVAATLSGVFSLEDALYLVLMRGKLMQSAQPGTMLSVQLSHQELLPLMPKDLDLAAVNGPELCVVSGESASIVQFAHYLSSINVGHSQLHTSHAFHSRMMQPILAEFRALFKTIDINEPQIPVLSNVTGNWLTIDQARNPNYWCDHIRMPVLFYQGIQTAFNGLNSPLFIEVGPGRTLATLVKHADPKSETVHTIRHPIQKDADEVVFLNAIGTLWRKGIEIEMERLHPGNLPGRASLPTYCFDHTDFVIQQTTRASQMPQTLPSNSYPATDRVVCKVETKQNECKDRGLSPCDATTVMKEIWKSVLGIAAIDDEDNFFELGGHSLLATQLIGQAEALLGVELEVRDVFQYSSLRELSQHIKELPGLKHSQQIPAKTDESTGFASTSLSSQQKSLWVLHELHGKTFNAYNEPILFKIDGAFSVDAFREAFIRVMERHEILRTKITKDADGNLLQQADSLKVDFKVLKSCKQDCEQDMLEEIAKPFDLTCAPLFRIRVYDLGHQQSMVLMVFSHLLLDGASLRILCRELSEAYQGIVQNRGFQLPVLKNQYRDYVKWQDKFIGTEEYGKQIAFWKEKLSGYQELNLTQNRPRKSVFSYQGGKYHFDYGVELSNKLSLLAKQEKTTLFNIFLAGFGTLLSRYCRQEDILIGAPMLNRPGKDFHELVGFFTNMVVLRNCFSGDLSFKELLKHVNQNTLIAYENQEVSFDHVVSHLNIDRDASRNPLVQVRLLVVNNKSKPQLSIGNAVSTFVMPPAHPIAIMDLSLCVFEQENSITGYIEYSTDIFEVNGIALFSNHLQRLFARVIDHLEQPLKMLTIMDNDDEKKLLIDWNPRYNKRQGNTTLHEAFMKTASAVPNKTALKFGTQTLTYAELNKRSTQLAHFLLKRCGASLNGGQALARDTLIAICVEPSFDTIVSILGILKAGGAYVPIDPNYPALRIEHIVSDSKAPQIIVQKKMLSKIDSLAKLPPDRIIVIDDEEVQSEISKQPTDLDLTYDTDGLAYVIYTSGSTGKPKGVLLPHKNVLDLFYAGKEHYDFNSDDVWVLFHSFAFDVSVWEMWGTFLYGGSMVIVPFEVTRDPHTFYEITKQEKITVLNQTPSAFRNYMDADVAAPVKIDTLRYVIFAGEALDIETLRDWWRSHDDRHPLLVNMYGITETTVHATYQELYKSHLDEAKHGRIGSPLNHLRMYVLNEQRSLCPVGVPGELYVGGTGVSRGYLNRDDLTVQRFIPNPFAEKCGLPSNDCLYKSGDLVRWMPDGTLEYIGRTDFQVKLRGFRIELGEIESVIIKYPGIKQAIVLMCEEDNNKYLACYFTLNTHNDLLDLQKLRSHLRQSLPEYMVPGAFVKMDKIPLTVNGKVDRPSLPKPDMSAMGGIYTPPTTAFEKEITKIWSDILHIDTSKISIDANYFQLGGNSISTVKMISKVKAMSGMDFPLYLFWKGPTIRSLAKLIEGQGDTLTDPLLRTKRLIEKDLLLADAIQPLKPFKSTPRSPRKVLLTGATGFLGAHLLEQLRMIDGVEIFCLVRGDDPANAKERLNSSLIDNRLSHLVDHPRIQVVHGDLAKPRLGLSDRDYSHLAETIEAIYHNGALVHHLYDYERMRAENVGSTQEILKLAVTVRNKAVHFISTISVRDFDISQKLHSESLNWSFIEMNGYLLTKWVSEQLIIEAAKRGIAAHVYRPGNITGHSETGHCHPELNHTLRKVKGFIELGQAYIDDSEPFEMAPVDLLARDIIQKSFDHQDKVVFNMDNGVKIPFTAYLDKYINSAFPIKKVSSLVDWKRLISNLTEDNPLYSLQAFYDHHDEIEQTFRKPTYPSDLNQPIPDYDRLIAKQIEFLEKSNYLKKPACHAK